MQAMPLLQSACQSAMPSVFYFKEGPPMLHNQCELRDMAMWTGGTQGVKLSRVMNQWQQKLGVVSPNEFRFSLHFTEVGGLLERVAGIDHADANRDVK